VSILVVEDDVEVSQCVGQLLRAEGYAVHTVADGEAALGYLSTREPPSLVILDLGLPRVDGATLRLRMRETPAWAAIPVVILSARRNAARIVAQLLPAELVKKPFHVDELLHVVQNQATTVPRAEHFLRGAFRRRL
jgi:DNA-binding response OmpR family regulator